jgi:hypothetical protein
MADANSLLPTETAPPGLTEDEYDAILEDHELYFEACLQIRTKSEGLVPFKLNAVQRIVHEKCEEQIRRTGRVRLIVLKGRQMGCSTYVGARYYRKSSTSHGVLVYIVTHEDAATQNLFGMAKRYHEYCLPDFKPPTSVANANELVFGELDSSYKIATAGARSAGRSATIQCLHASEFDFWPAATADDVWTGLTEALANADGTECVIESTANTPGGRFHRAWKAAKAGESSFEALFLPWFWHDDYRTEPPAGWVPPPRFVEYGLLHGIETDRLYWAWLKNRDMAMTFATSPDEFCHEFKREYPATDEEAFETAGDDFVRVFPKAWIDAAQARWIANKSQPLKPMSGLGVDVAQGGKDKTALAPFHGVRLQPLVVVPGAVTPDGPAVAALTVTHVRDGATIGIDMGGGYGGDAYTHLKKHLELPVIAINGAEGTSAKTRDHKHEFPLERDALHWQFREALNPETGDNIELPPDPDLIEEMLAATFEITPRGIKICPKDDMKVVLKRSPDRLDAVLNGWRAGDKHSRLLAAARRARSSPSVTRQYSKVIGRK